MNLKIVKVDDTYMLVTEDEDGNQSMVKQSEDFKSVQKVYLDMTHEAAMSKLRDLHRRG